jgi:hypothetical protein
LVLDVSISPGDDLDTFFEGIGVPTDWLTPANTYLEFLRQTAAMFQFNQRSGIEHFRDQRVVFGLAAVTPMNVCGLGQILDFFYPLLERCVACGHSLPRFFTHRH